MGMHVGGKPKNKNSGGLRSQGEFAKGLCREGVCSRPEPLEWPVPQGQDPVPESTASEATVTSPSQGPLLSLLFNQMFLMEKYCHSISRNLETIPDWQTGGRVDDASLTPGSLRPRRSFHPALCASWWLEKVPRFSPAVKYFPCPLLSVLYAAKMLFLTLKNRKMFCSEKQKGKQLPIYIKNRDINQNTSQS